MRGFVYFLRPVGMDGPIKIGCSATPHGRLATYMSWSPLDLEIVAQVPGDLELEAKLHSRFFNAHRRNEWFEPVPDLVALIDALRRGGSLESAVDLSQSQGRIRSKQKRKMSPDTRECFHWAMSVAMKTHWADKRAGEDVRLMVPHSIQSIISRWQGAYNRPDTKQRPTEDEFAALKAYVDGLPGTAETYEQRYGHPFRPIVPLKAKPAPQHNGEGREVA